MKILIVEDDQNKLAQLTLFIKRHHKDAKIESRYSYRSGLARLLESDVFDLVLLDMSMPTYDKSPSESGGRHRPFGGKDILRQLDRHQVSVPVVIVTQFTQFGEGPSAVSLNALKQQLANEGYLNYRRTIFYSAEGTTWEQELAQLIDGGLQ